MLICRQCKGNNIQVKAWVDANTNKYISDAVGGDQDIWCENCGEHTQLEIIN